MAEQLYPFFYRSLDNNFIVNLYHKLDEWWYIINVSKTCDRLLIFFHCKVFHHLLGKDYKACAAEVILCDANYNSSCDIWSLGCVLAYLINESQKSEVR